MAAFKNALQSATYPAPSASLLHQARARSVSGCVAGDGPGSASGRAISTGYTGPRASLGSLFADTTEAVFVPFSGPRAALPLQQQQQQQQPPQQLRSAPGLAAVEAAARNSGGNSGGSAMSASDGTVQCPELPATRNPSASPINSPFSQASAFGVSGSAALPADSHSLPPRQPATPGAQCVPAATAAAVACCDEAAGGGLVSGARADSSAAAAATACEASEERRQSGGGCLTDPEASMSNLPPPVRVTVGPNAVRPQQQQQQQQPPGLSTAKKRGREAVQQQQQQWDVPDGGEDSDSEKTRAGGGGGRPAGGRAARRDTDDADEKPALFGMFLPERYMLGVDCIQVDGTFVSRSRFEKLGGSLMAKWYRSIRVVDTAEPLGTWLQRHGLPVFTGKARQRRQRILPHNVNAQATTAAAAASTRPTTGPTDAVKNQRSSNNSLTGNNDRQAEAAAGGAGAGPAPTPTPAAAHPSAGSDTEAGMSPGGAAGGGAAAAGAWAGSPAYEADPEPAAASAVMAIGGACGDEGFQGANTNVAAAARRAPGPHSGAWDGPVPCKPEQGQGQGSGPLGPQLPKAEVRRCGPALPLLPSAPDIDAGGAPGAPEAAAAAGAASRAAAGAIGGGGSGAGAARGSGGGATGARPSCLSLETLPKGAVAPGVHRIGGRMGLVERCAPPEGQQKLPEQPAQQQLQPSLSSQQQQPPPTQQQLPLEQQQQQRVAGLPVGNGWRSATDNGAASFSATGATSQAAAAFGSPPPPFGVPSRLDAGRDVAGWGPSLSAGDRLAAAVGVESPSTLFSFRRLGSDGAAGLAAGSHQLSACASASRPPLEAAQTAAHAASVTAPETIGGYGGGGGAFAAVPGPAPSCRLAEASSLESVPATAASRWVSSGYPVPTPAAAGLPPYGSYDAMVRRDWETDACPPPYGVLPTSASAPVQAPRYMHDPEQQHQHQHPAASQRLAHESSLRGLSPALWPPPRAKPPPQAVPARSSYTNTSYAAHQQLPCQGDEEQSSLADGGGQSVASAGAALDPSLTRPAAAAAAAAREAAPPPAAQGSGAGAGATHLPLTPPKSMHPYPPGGRHWPYGPQYAPYNPYGAHVRGGTPEAPTRHPVGAARGVRPYYRNVYPREMPPGGGMPPPLPPPPLHSPYVYYYGHPYHRRAPAVPPYCRRYAVSAPGTVEAPPPLSSYGARYDPNAVYGAYAPARPDLEAPLDVAEAEVGIASYPAAAGMSSGDVDPTTSPPAGMGHPVGTHAPAAAVAAAAPPVPAAAIAAVLPSRTSGGGCGGVVMPGNALLPMVQQRRPQQGAPAGPPYPSSWGGAPPPQVFWHLSANGHPPQSTIEGGLDLGLDADGVGAVPGNWRPEATGPASIMGPASAGASPFPAPSTAASMGLGRPAAAAAAAAADGRMGMLRPQAAAAGAGGEADIDPMWASFQRWSAYEGARASQ